jgi:CheY-like chemotaxis protein
MHLRRRKEQQDGVQRLQSTDPNTVLRPFALIVDDDPLVLSIAERSVRAMGYSTLVATSPEEAYRLAVALVPDVVLTDALMPRLDGRELCRKLKASEPTRHIKVIVMSAIYQGTAYRNQAFKEFGVDEFLAKPIKPAILREALDRLLPRLSRSRPQFADVRSAA